MNVGNNGRYTANNKHFVGNNNSVTGNGNTITGNNNQVTGNDNQGTGNNNAIAGDRNRWTGNNNKLMGKDSSAFGRNNKINGEAAADHEGQGSQGIIINGMTIGDVGDGEVVIRRGANGGIAQMITSGGATFTFGGGGIIGTVGNGGTITMAGERNTAVARRGGIAVAGQSQIALGSVAGGMHMDNSKQKAKKTKKRDRSPSPSFIEVPLETDKDEEAPEGATACVVCITSLPLRAATPCGHKCLCCKCARQLGKDGTAQKGTVQCPVCREKVDAIRRIY